MAKRKSQVVVCHVCGDITSEDIWEVNFENSWAGIVENGNFIFDEFKERTIIGFMWRKANEAYLNGKVLCLGCQIRQWEDLEQIAYTRLAKRKRPPSFILNPQKFGLIARQ